MLTIITCVMTLCLAGEPCREGPDQAQTFRAGIEDGSDIGFFWTNGDLTTEPIPGIVTRGQDLGGAPRIEIHVPGDLLWSTWTVVVWPERGEGAISTIARPLLVPLGVGGGTRPCTIETGTI